MFRENTTPGLHYLWKRNHLNLVIVSIMYVMSIAFRRVVRAGFAAFFVALIVVCVTAQNPKKGMDAKDYFKEGERLQKLGLNIDAYERFKTAESFRPTDAKYKKKRLEAGRLAALDYMGKARATRQRDALEALRYITLAREADSSNQDAVEAEKKINDDLTEVIAFVVDSMEALEKGDLKPGLATIEKYGEFESWIEIYRKLKFAVTVAKEIDEAVRHWASREVDEALRKLESAERNDPENKYVQLVGGRLRREISNELFGKIASMSDEGFAAALMKAERISELITIDPANPKLREAQSQITKKIVSFLLSGVSEISGEMAEKRVALQRLKWLRMRLNSFSEIDDYVNRLRPSVYPHISVRMNAGIPQGCQFAIDHKEVVEIVAESLEPFARVDSSGEIEFKIREIACSKTEPLKKSIEDVNSTYIVGYNQVANPQYVIYERELQSAQAALNRAQVSNSINPNIGNAIAVGIAQGRVNRILREMREIAPYIAEPVVQSYKYQKFEAFKAVRVEANVQLVGKFGTKNYVDERRVSVTVDDRDTGFSGVLATDRSGTYNKEPVLRGDSELMSEGIGRFRSGLKRSVKEMTGAAFSALAMDANLPPNLRLSYFLFSTDYFTETDFDDSANRSLLKLYDLFASGADDVSAFVNSLNLPTPESAKYGEVAQLNEQRPETVIANALEGVVAVETDHSSGSGFFVNQSCSVITSAHVLAGAETIIIRNSAKRIFIATILAIDDSRDLAILKTNATECKVIPFGDTAALRVGQDVYAIGSPLGLTGTVTKGIVSNLRTFSNGSNYIQLDASMNPGNSGGPLINSAGAIIGVNTFKVKGFEGLNFAISAGEIRKAFSVLLHDR